MKQLSDIILLQAFAVVGTYNLLNVEHTCQVHKLILQGISMANFVVEIVEAKVAFAEV